MLRSTWRGALAAAALSVSSVSCAADSGFAVETPFVVEGTVDTVIMTAAPSRVQVLLHPNESFRNGANVHIVGRELGGRDQLLRQVLASVADGTIAPGARVRFRTFGEVRTGAPTYYATHLLR